MGYHGQRIGVGASDPSLSTGKALLEPCLLADRTAAAAATSQPKDSRSTP